MFLQIRLTNHVLHLFQLSSFSLINSLYVHLFHLFNSLNVHIRLVDLKSYNNRKIAEKIYSRFTPKYWQYFCEYDLSRQYNDYNSNENRNENSNENRIDRDDICQSSYDIKNSEHHQNMNVHSVIKHDNLVHVISSTEDYLLYEYCDWTLEDLLMESKSKLTNETSEKIYTFASSHTQIVDQLNSSPSIDKEFSNNSELNEKISSSNINNGNTQIQQYSIKNKLFYDINMFKYRTYLMKQLLEGINYLHSNGWIHRDLKPSNIFVNNDCRLMIGDLDLLANANEILEDGSTTPIQTLNYTSPEILFGENFYSESIDIWSFGVIFFELMVGEPLFTSVSQIDLICQISTIIGPPSEEVWPKFSTYPSSQYFTFTGEDTLHQRIHEKLKGKLSNHILDLFEDLLRKILIYDFSKRISAEDALKHPFFLEMDISDSIESDLIEVNSYTIDSNTNKDLNMNKKRKRCNEFTTFQKVKRSTQDKIDPIKK